MVEYDEPMCVVKNIMTMGDSLKKDKSKKKKLNTFVFFFVLALIIYNCVSAYMVMIRTVRAVAQSQMEDVANKAIHYAIAEVSEEFDYAVTDAAVSNSGNYAVVTSTREYPYAIYVYNKDFKRIGEYYKNKYVMDVIISDDGEDLIILSFYAENGDYRTEILLCDTSGKTEERAVTISGRFPMMAEYNENGGFTVITDGGAYVYSSEAELIKTVTVNDEILSRAALGETSSALFYKKNKNASETTVVLFDNDGNIIYNDCIYGKITDASIFGDKLYVLLDNSVVLIDPKHDEHKTAVCSSGGRSILVYSSSIGGTINAAVVYNSSVVTVNFE